MNAIIEKLSKFIIGLKSQTKIKHVFAKKLFFTISLIFLVACEDRDYQDCNGIINGGAYYDDCGECVGGRTGLTECLSLIHI